MAQDWFEANAPKADTTPPPSGGDWFTQNAPKRKTGGGTPAVDFTANPKKEGVYQMAEPGVSTTGREYKTVSIPYSNVMAASQAGWRIKPEDRENYTYDRQYELWKNKAPWSEIQSLVLPEAAQERPGVWNRVERGVQKVTEPTTKQSGMPVPFFTPAGRELQLNVLKRFGRDLFGMVDMPVQVYNAMEDSLSGDPKKAMDAEARLRAMAPEEQAWNRFKEFRQDYRRDPKLAIANVFGDASAIAATEKLGELPGKVLASDRVTKVMPKKIIQRLIKSGGKDTLFGKDPAQAILDQGIVGNNLREIGDGAYAKLHEVGKNIDKVAQSPANAGKSVNVQGILKPFTDAMDEARKAGDVKLYNRLRDARNELYFEWQVKTTPKGRTILQPSGPRNLTSMSPHEALEFKRRIGDRIRWTQDPLDGAVNKTLGSAYGIVKDSLNNVLGSDFAKLNEQYSDLVGAVKSIERQIPVEDRGANWKLTDIVLGATGHPFIAAARMASHHPGFRTRGARFLHQTAPNMQPSAAFEKAPPIATALGIGQRAGDKKPDDKKPVAQPPTSAAAPSSKPSAEHVAISPFAFAVSFQEGFGTPNTIPTLANNPGALSVGNIGYGYLTSADGTQITVFPSPQAGWTALNKQLNLIFSGKSGKYSSDMTLEQFGQTYGRDANYGAQIAKSLAVDPSTTLGDLAKSLTSAPAPLPAAKTEAAARKPSPVTPAPAAPSKHYEYTASGEGGHKIGSNDGVTWFDIQTGQRI